MAFGFQINDPLGNKILDQNSLATYIAGSGVIPANPADSAVQYLAFPQINANVITAVATSRINPSGAHGYLAALTWDIATHSVKIVGPTDTPTSFDILASGRVPNSISYGIETGDYEVLNNDFAQFIFIGKAVYSGETPDPNNTQFSYNFWQTFTITMPTNVTKIYPFVHTTSALGNIVTKITYSGNIATLQASINRTLPWGFQAGDTNAEIYCFASMHEMGACPNCNQGIRLYGANGSVYFDGGYGRKIMRNMDVFSFKLNTWANGVTMYAYAISNATHPWKAKPAYYTAGDWRMTSLVPSVGYNSTITFHNSGPYTFVTVTPLQQVGVVSTASFAPVEIPVLDGADYD